MRLPPWRVRPSTFFYLLVAFIATAPAWIVEHPPLQDLPFHVATLRLIRSIHDPAFGFGDVYRLNLLHTEYLLYYLVGWVFSLFIGVKAANVVLMSLYLGGMPLGMRALLRAMGRDERLAIFAAPLGVNVMFCMGLLPFVFGFPMMLFSMAAAVRHFERPTLRSGVILAVLTLLTFFTHVLPFALFGVACLALFPWTRPRRWLTSAAPPAVGVALVAWWILGSQAGGNAMANVTKQTPFAGTYAGAFQQFLKWSTDIFHDPSDELWWIVLGAVAVLGMSLSMGDRDEAHPVARGWFILPLVCAIGYVTFGNELGVVWLFGQRFAVPLLLTMIPLLRMPRGGRGALVAAAAVAALVGSTINVCKHFIQFEREEVGDLDDALASMAPRAHVAGLIFDRGSSIMSDTYVPFMHFVSYYQVEKGGVVQFAYTGFPHWPVQYQDGHYPPETFPRLRLRWEWTPEQVSIQELFPYYDYVLVRGRGFNPPGDKYRASYRGPRWTVFERVGR